MARSLPNLGLEGFFGLGEDGWNDEMDNNLLRLSTLVQAGAINSVSVLPSSPSQGDVYILNEVAVSNPNTLAVRDDGQWVYLTPQVGWMVFNRFANQFLYFNGTIWDGLVTSTSGAASVPQRWELTFNPLGNEPPIDDYATIDTRNNRPVLDFSDTTRESAIWSSKLPDIYAGSGLLIEIFFAASSGTAGNVVWEASVERMNLGSLDLDSENFATPILSDGIAVSSNSGELSRAFIYLTEGTQTNGLQAGELFRLRIARVPTNPNDTLVGDAELVSVYVREPMAPPMAGGIINGSLRSARYWQIRPIQSEIGSFGVAYIDFKGEDGVSLIGSGTPSNPAVFDFSFSGTGDIPAPWTYDFGVGQFVTVAQVDLASVDNLFRDRTPTWFAVFAGDDLSEMSLVAQFACGNWSTSQLRSFFIPAIADGGATNPEIVRDTVASALVEGDNITIEHDDVGNTITISSTGGGGGGGAIRIEDENNTIVASATAINFVGPGVSVTDSGGGEAVVTINGGGGSSSGGVGSIAKIIQNRPPRASSFPSIIGSPTINSVTGALVLQGAPDSGAQIRAIMKPAQTGLFTVTTRFQAALSTNFNHAGIVFTNGTSYVIVGAVYVFGNSIEITGFSNDRTFDTGAGNMQFSSNPPPEWFRAVANSTTGSITGYYSWDGEYWFLMGTLAYLPAITSYGLCVVSRGGGAVNASFTYYEDGSVDDGIEVSSFGGGEGGITLISEFVATGGETQVDFEDIPSTFKGLKLLTYARGTAIANDTAFQLQFNDDTTTAYGYRQQFFPFGSAGASGVSSASTVQFACVNAPTNVFDAGVIEIPHYAATAGHKSGVFSCQNTEGSSQSRTILGSFVWQQNDAIDKVTLLVGVGSLAAGSRVALYGYGDGRRDEAVLQKVNKPSSSQFPQFYGAAGAALSLTDTEYGCYFQRTDTGSGEMNAVLATTVPGATWRATLGARVTPFSRANQFIRQGLACTNGTGYVSCQFNTQSGSPALETVYYGNANTYTDGAVFAPVSGTSVVFFRLTCNGTNIVSEFSTDGGSTWILSHSRLISSTFTPTHVGLFSNSFNPITPEYTGMSVFYWELI